MPRAFKRTACASLFCACLLAGSCSGALAAGEYELRMPVEKTARITPGGDAERQDKAKAKALPQPAKATPKTAMGRAVEAAASSAAPPLETSASEAEPTKTVKIRKSKPEAKADAKHAAKGETEQHSGSEAHAAPAGRTVVSAGAPIPVKIPDSPASDAASAEPKRPAKAVAKAAPHPAAEAKTKPAPQVDPLALKIPAAPEKAAPLPALPSDGLWLGGVSVDYHESALVLRLATNAQIERVTWFNVAEPRRLALDLRGQWHKKGPMLLRFDSGPVKHILVGEHPDRLRLSLEFRDGAVAPMLDPKIETGEQGASLTIPLAVKLSR